MAYGNVSQRRMAVQDLHQAVTWGTRALELARDLDDEEALVYALTNIGTAEVQAGLQEGLPKQERALELAQTHGLEDYAGRAFMSIVRCAVEQRNFELADEYLERGMEYCNERGLDTWRLYLLGFRSRVELDGGRWEEAIASAEAILRAPRSAPIPRGVALITLGLVRTRRGDPEAAVPLAEEHALATPTEEPVRIGWIAAARAEAAWVAGDHATVLRGDRGSAFARAATSPTVAGR